MIVILISAVLLLAVLMSYLLVKMKQVQQQSNAAIYLLCLLSVSAKYQLKDANKKAAKNVDFKSMAEIMEAIDKLSKIYD